MFINSLKLDDIFRRKALQIGLLCSAMIPVKRFNSNKPTHTQSGSVRQGENLWIAKKTKNILQILPSCLKEREFRVYS